MNGRLLVAALVVSGLTACADTAQQLTTGTISGKPETTFKNASLPDVKNRIATYCTNSQLNVVEASDHTVGCEFESRLADQVFVKVFVGNQRSTPARTKFKFTLLQQGADVRVVARQWIETQTAFGQTRSVELNDGLRYVQTQQLLDVWAHGAPICRTMQREDWQSLCDRVHPGWRSESAT